MSRVDMLLGKKETTNKNQDKSEKVEAILFYSKKK